jgi:hypothetical protein
MSFVGKVEFVEGRSASETTSLVLRHCLGCGKDDNGVAIGSFLKRLKISPIAFFKDIDGDWHDRPFVGQHVFKVVTAAGYEGTEHDLWLAVTGNLAPYAAKGRPRSAKAQAPAQPKADVEAMKAARHTAIKEAWTSRRAACVAQ